MAQWKKIIVSGSDAELRSLETDLLIQVGSNQIISSSAADTKLSGSFSGSFFGDGSGLSNVTATTVNSLNEGVGISPFTFDGSSEVNVEVSGAAQLTDSTLVMWDDEDGKFVDSLITQSGGDVIISATGEVAITAPDGLYINTGTSAVNISGSLDVTGPVTAPSFTGSFSGSFFGNGSGLTGLATNLSGSADSGSFEIDLLNQFLNIQGTPNEIETSATGQTVTIGLPDSVIISQNLTVGGDLTVNGETTVINTVNVVIEDKFVLYASGSTEPTDGGIVIQSGITNGDVVGFAYGYDSDKTRWAFESDFDHTTSTFITPDSFITSTQFGVDNTRPTDPQYGGSSYGYGNIWVSTDTGDIYMWA
jgi:hypothetical protein